MNGSIDSVRYSDIAGKENKMNLRIENEVRERSGGHCELCGAAKELVVYVVPPAKGDHADQCLMACPVCLAQLQAPETADQTHWRCLNDSMWSTVPAVQVAAWRMLDHLRPHGWSGDLLDMLYLEAATLAWAQAELDEKEEQIIHKDSFGTVLHAGDTVILTQSLDVKGANFTAKRGTAVRGISLVADNAEQIEGRVEGQKIVILTKFVKKST